MSKLILEIPYLPPSVNEAYKFNRKTGVMYLVKEAAAFKKGLGLHLNEKYLKEIQLLFIKPVTIFIFLKKILSMKNLEKTNASKAYTKQ